MLPTQVANTMTDIVVVTGGIYFTGGPASPILPAYVIVIAVLSLLANVGVTALATWVRSRSVAG